MKKIALLLIIGSLAACQSDAKKPAETQTPAQQNNTAATQTQNTAVEDITSAPSIFFDTDKSNIKPEYRDAIVKAADIMKADSKAKVMIEGNCDERGSSEYNLGLGARRAESVKRQLEAAGIASNRIKTHSLGESNPRSTCHDESCWQENRRADFTSAQ